MNPWTPAAIPDQTGRTVIVTGASSGIGLETARVLATKGADVVLACRHPERGVAALERIQEELPSGNITLLELDLADLNTITAFAAAFSAKHKRLDLLINNAGVMLPPPARTAQGFELQFGTNYLGHFALTGLLLPMMIGVKGSRIVTVSSAAHRRGRIDLQDINWTRRRYKGWPAYSQSKLANLIFAIELQRRLAAVGSPARSVAAHPGWTATELQRSTDIGRLANPLFAMRPAEGALPVLRAAIDRDAEGGSYWGPSGRLELSGPPVRARIGVRALDQSVALRLWELSEELTGVAFQFPKQQPKHYRTAA
jgi:NAD(P)-dependent dehydrogenase (short-subunit alcohol dehydrogenase family)